MLKKCLLSLGLVIIVIAVYFPTRHARHYEYIQINNIFDSLELRISNFYNSNLKGCNYNNIILRNEDIDINSISTANRNFSEPFAGKC